MAVPLIKRKKERALRKALSQSLIVLIGASIWIALFRINDPLALSEAWKSIISLQGIFLSFGAIIAGIISYTFIGGRYKTIDEALVATFLILLAGLTEAWGLGARPAFLPALIIVIYLMTKIWMSYRSQIKLLKRAYR